MTETCDKRTYKYVRYVLTGILLIFVVCAAYGVFVNTAYSKAENSPKWNKACKKYMAFLKKNVSEYEVEEGNFTKENKENYKKCSSFILCDLNSDGVPELVTWHDIAYKTARLYVFRYKNGKVVNVKLKHKNPMKNSPKEFIDVSTNAAGTFEVYTDNKGYLHTDYSFGEISEKIIYCMKSGKVTEYLQSVEDDMYTNSHYYYVNGKKVSKKKYSKKADKLERSSEYEMTLNNESGRNKIYESGN